MATSATTDTLTLNVTGMTCGSCKRHVEQALSGVGGVQDAEVDLAGGRATVRVDGATPEQLIQAVRDAGYGADLASAGADTPRGAGGCACCVTQIA